MGHAELQTAATGTRLRVRITNVQKGDVTASIKMTVIRIPPSLTSIISREAVDDLDLKEGDEVVAIVKSTEVLIAKEAVGARRAN